MISDSPLPKMSWEMPLIPVVGADHVVSFGNSFLGINNKIIIILHQREGKQFVESIKN